MFKRISVLALSSTLLLSACTGTPTGITATANPTTVSSGGTSTLSATLTGTGSFNIGVGWEIKSGGGSLSKNYDGSTVTYTAPTVTANTTVQINAYASAAPNQVSQVLTLTVQP